MDRIFLEGKFHSEVPEQIVKDYQKVERVLCYAYYHYPLLDESYSIATKIFEAAIKIRLEELNLPSRGNLKGKINRLEEYSSQQLVQNWQFIREVRNHFAHPKPGSLMGITLIRSFTRMVNILNSIFLRKEEILKREKELEIIKEQAAYFDTDLFVLLGGEERYLIYIVAPCAIVDTNSTSKSLWAFQPVLVDFPQTMDKASIGKPVFKSLRDVQLVQSGLTGFDLDSGSKVQLIQNTFKENQDHFNRYKEQYDISDEVVKAFYTQHRDMEISNEIERFLYREAWHN